MGRPRKRRVKLRLDDLEPRHDEPEPESWQDIRDSVVAEKRLKALTPNQGLYIKAIETSTVTFCSGPAGTGKSFVACGIAAQQLKDGRISKIVLTRPLITCGRSFGFLPGTVDEKVGPHMRPLLDAFEEFFPPRELERLIRDKVIEMWPLELMRGASIKNAFIICDEAQNAEYVQLHMLLTRFGERSRVVINGDTRQTDLPTQSPLLLIIKRLSGHPEIYHVKFGKEDVVRHELISWIDERLGEPDRFGDGVPT